MSSVDGKPIRGTGDGGPSGTVGAVHVDAVHTSTESVYFGVQNTTFILTPNRSYLSVRRSSPGPVVPLVRSRAAD
jgi:hypothetical protein